MKRLELTDNTNLYDPPYELVTDFGFNGVWRYLSGIFTVFFSSLLLSSIESSDTQVYEPWVRALLGTASRKSTVQGLGLGSKKMKRLELTDNTNLYDPPYELVADFGFKGVWRYLSGK